jgi:hypothetical protein
MVVYIDSIVTDRDGKSGTICHIEYNGTFKVEWEDGTKTFHPITQAPETKPLQSINLHHKHFARATTPVSKPKSVSPPMAPQRESHMTFPHDDRKYRDAKCR